MTRKKAINIPCFLIWVLICLPVISIAAEEAYQPIFSREILEKAEPEARARLVELEARNRARWEASRSEKVELRDGGMDSRTSSIYRHVDAQGNVIYADSSPGNDASALEIKIQTPDEQSLLEHKRMLEQQTHALELFEDEKRLREQQAAQRKNQQLAREEHQRQCVELGNEIADYQRGGSVYYALDEKGQRQYLSDEELAQKVADLQSDYRKYCR